MSSLLLSKPEELICFRLGAALWQNVHLEAAVADLQRQVADLTAKLPKEEAPKGLASTVARVPSAGGPGG